MTSYGPYRFTVTEDDVSQAAKATSWRRLWLPPFRYLVIAIAVCFVLLLVLDLSDGSIDISTLILLIGGPAIFAVLIQWLGPVFAKRQYRQNAALRVENTLTFDAKDIELSSERGVTRLPVNELFRYSETDGLVLLHISEAIFIPVPRRALGDDAATLAALLERSGVPRL